MEREKQKAKDLVDSFNKYSHRGWSEKWGYDQEEGLENAKQCALMCCKEVLSNQPFDIYTMEQSNNVNNYWQEVKNQIKKL